MKIRFYLHRVRQTDLDVPNSMMKGMMAKTDKTRTKHMNAFHELVGGFSDTVRCIGMNFVEGYAYAGSEYDGIHVAELDKNRK